MLEKRLQSYAYELYSIFDNLQLFCLYRLSTEIE